MLIINVYLSRHNWSVGILLYVGHYTLIDWFIWIFLTINSHDNCNILTITWHVSLVDQEFIILLRHRSLLPIVIRIVHFLFLYIIFCKDRVRTPLKVSDLYHYKFSSVKRGWKYQKEVLRRNAITTWKWWKRHALVYETLHRKQ
jgi:hypothetical protein